MPRRPPMTDTPPAWSASATSPSTRPCPPRGTRVESVGGDALFAALAARAGRRQSHGPRPAGYRCDAGSARRNPLGRDGSRDAATTRAAHDPQCHPLRRHRRASVGSGPGRGALRGALGASRRRVRRRRWPRPGVLRVGDGAARSARAGGVAARRAPRRQSISIRRRTTSPATRPRCGMPCERCDVFLPSEVEAAALAGTSDLHAAAATFLQLGPQVVVIKLAAAGCLVATRQRPEPTVVPTDVIEPVDSTGAGDAFCGAFAAEHLRSGDAYAAAEAGRGAARIAVGGPGVGGLLAAVTRRRMADDADHRDQPEHFRRADGHHHQGGPSGRGRRRDGHRGPPCGGCAQRRKPCRGGDRRRRGDRAGPCAPGPTPTRSSSPASATPGCPRPARSPPARSSG